MKSDEPLEKPVVVVGPQFLGQHPIDLTLAGKLRTLGKNDFDVVDANGAQIFKIKSKPCSRHSRRELLDATGNTLITFRQKLTSVHCRWHAFRGNSADQKDLLFSVKNRHYIQLRPRLDVFLAGNTEQQTPDFHVEGSSTDGYYTIYLGNSDKILAQMYHTYVLKTCLLGVNKFAVTVHPSVDYAFITVLVVIIDEIND